MHTSAFPRDGDDNENGFHGGQSESEGLQRVGLRAVSQSHACTPRVPRTAARVLSRGNDGRPVALDRGHIRRPENQDERACVITVRVLFYPRGFFKKRPGNRALLVTRIPRKIEKDSCYASESEGSLLISFKFIEYFS